MVNYLISSDGFNEIDIEDIAMMLGHR